MEQNQLIGIAIAAIISIFGMIKIELIKSIVSKITSGKGNVSAFSILVLLGISIIPAIVGFNIPEHKADSQNIEMQNEKKEKSKEEIYLEAGREIAGAVEKISKNKHFNDSVFNATRPQRWVIQIGEIMDNEESILEAYNSISDRDNVCLFKHKRKYYLFKNVKYTHKELEEDFEKMKSFYNKPISMLDLMSFCRNEKEKLVMTEKEKIGHGKDNVRIDCFEISK